MSQYFPKRYEPTKTDLKSVTHVDVSSFAIKSDLANLKTKVDKLDIDKLTPVPDDLAKLSNVVKNDVVKKTAYDKLVAKVNNIDTTGFVKRKLDKKIPSVSGLVKKTDVNSKISEVEGKIPSISGLPTNSELTAVQNKIPDVNALIKNTDYDTKISETEKKITDHDHEKYFTTPEFNTLAATVFNAKLAQADLVTKTDFDAELKKNSDRVTSNKFKHLLLENKLKKLKTFDLNYFKGKNYFEGNDGAQNTLVFQTRQKHFDLRNVNQINE